jgi:hypothetical protein
LAFFLSYTNRDITMMQPNNSLQPTPVGRLSSAFAVNILSPAWLSFIRSAARRGQHHALSAARSIALRDAGSASSRGIRACCGQVDTGVYDASSSDRPLVRSESTALGAFRVPGSPRTAFPASPPPNKSPEPMTVGRRSSASRVMSCCPSWLSFYVRRRSRTFFI